MLDVLGIILVGAILGLLGKFVAPGDRDNIPLWLTIICGIVGMFAGSYLYYAIFGVADGYDGNMFDTSKGADWMRWAWEIVAAAFAVMAAAFVTGRGKARV